MSQPPAYSRSFSFSNFQSSNPALSLPGSQVDLELNNAKATIDAVLANLALIQRDDGGVKNASIGYDQLKSEITVGFNAPVVWTTATAYLANSSTVFNGSGFYRALIAHTSGVFATDLAAGRWQLIVNLAAVPLVAASQIAVTPSGLLTTDAQTSLQALDTGKAPLSHSQAASTISDSTAAGRALLTAADANAQNLLLGTTTLGFQSGDIKETACPVLQSGWYYCDGSAKNRVTDVNLFNAITIQQTGVLTSSAPTVTGLTDTSNMSSGMPVSGTGIPASTVILSVDSGTQVTLSQNATSGGTTPLVFAPHGVGDGSTTFGLPNRAYLAVGRDNASGSASNIQQVSTTFGITISTNSGVVASATGLVVGMFAAHPKLPSGTKITAIVGTTVTFSNNATATVVTGAIRFSFILDAQALGATGGALSATTTLVTANLPPYTPGGAVVNGTIAINNGGGLATFATQPGGNALAGGGSFGNGAAPTITASQGGTSFTGNAQGGISTPVRVATAMPIIVMNFIIKR